MKHTEPGFVPYLICYLLLGAGSILVIGEIIEWNFLGKQLSLTTGLLTVWGAIMALIALHSHRRQQQEALENEDNIYGEVSVHVEMPPENQFPELPTQSD